MVGERDTIRCTPDMQMAVGEEVRGEADIVDVDVGEADNHLPLLDFHSPLVDVEEHRADIHDSGLANFDCMHIRRRMRAYLPLAVNLMVLAMAAAGPLRCQAMKVDRHVVEVVAVMTDRNRCTTAEEDTSRRRNRTVVVVAHDAYVEAGHSGVDGDVHKDRIRVLVAVVEGPPNWEDLCSDTVDILVVAVDGK